MSDMADFDQFRNGVLSILFALFGAAFSFIPSCQHFAWVAFLIGLVLGALAWRSLWGKIGAAINGAYFAYFVGFILFTVVAIRPSH